jgi:hypothetical protein
MEVAEPGPQGTQVRLLLADGTVTEPQGDPALLERIAYLAAGLLPQAAPRLSAVEIGPTEATPRPSPRVRLVLEDGSTLDAGSDPELARRIDYLAANLLPARP